MKNNREKKTERKRINIRLDDPVFDELHDLKRLGKFKQKSTGHPNIDFNIIKSLAIKPIFDVVTIILSSYFQKIIGLGC